MKPMCSVCRSILVLLFTLILPLGALAQGPFAQYVKVAGSAPFIVADKPTLKLTLVDAEGHVIRQYGMACAVHYGPKQVRGDNKTPEGVFKINQLLYAKGIPHDFGDGKGPVKDAYGPWFLRLDVPASATSASTAPRSRKASAPAPPKAASASPTRTLLT